MAEKKFQGENHEGPDRSAPYGLSRLAPSMTLVDVATEIQRADEMIGETTSSKLKVIAEQIRQLQRQANEILEAAKRDLDLHRASCAFSRTVGQVYHLYERSSNQHYWSLLSPEDWGVSPPHPYVGSYRLEPDQSWTPVKEIDVDGEQPFAGQDIVSALLPPG